MPAETGMKPLVFKLAKAFLRHEQSSLPKDWGSCAKSVYLLEKDFQPANVLPNLHWAGQQRIF